MFKARAVLGAAAVVLVTAGVLTAVLHDDRGRAVFGEVTWSDEFDGAAGTPVDATKWGFDLGTGYGNGELQVYTDSTGNVSLDGQGHLAITARAENGGYTSGRLVTHSTFTQRYGRFEARIIVPKGQGIWPAFWMLGDDMDTVGWPRAGEIDIMENIGREPRTIHGTIHGPGYSGAGGIGGGLTRLAPVGDAFHTYAVEWSPNLIVWLLDGAEYFRVTPATLGGRPWVFDHPFFLLLNVAVGGEWPGNPDATTRFPQSMLVDWVRVRGLSEPDGADGLG